MTLTRRALMLATGMAVVAAGAQAAETSAFIVYFEPGLAARDAKAYAVAAEAAQWTLSGKLARVRITGHADAAEPDAFDLSMTRAKAVADILVQRGVPASIILVDGKGATQPAVRTPPGAAEALNRRAEIDVAFQR